MSYDLYLIPKVFDTKAIRAFFEGRLHYQVGDSQAVYDNEDTGVYFIFDTVAVAGIYDEEEAGRAPHVALNLNYYRPHIFALEAEPEVAAFVQAFTCSVFDPQVDGMEDGIYSRERFLAGWTKGNRFGVQAISQQNGEAPLVADPRQIEEAWAWNYRRGELQERLGENVFVPKVIWLLPMQGLAPVRCVTWTFGAPTMIPETLITHIVLVRQKRPSLKKMFARRDAESEAEIKLLSVENGIRLRGLERGEMDGRSVIQTPVTGPLEVQALFSGDWPKPQFQVLPPEAVLGNDLVDWK